MTTVAIMPTPTIGAWIRPQAVGQANTTGLVVGGSYAAGVIGGGNTYSVQEFMADIGNDVQDLELAAMESVTVYGRNPTASLVADLGAAAIVTLYAYMAAATVTTLGITHGNTATNKVMIFAPAAVLTGIDDSVQGNLMLNSAQFTLQPSASFNDDLRFVAL